MFTLKTKYGNYKDCRIITKGSGKYTRYEIWDNENGSIVNVNLPGYGESETVIAIDHNFKNDILAFLKEHNLIVEYLGEIPSGYVTLPIIRIDAEKLKKL